MQFRHIKKSHAIFRPSTPSHQISKCMFLFEQSYMHFNCCDVCKRLQPITVPTFVSNDDPNCFDWHLCLGPKLRIVRQIWNVHWRWLRVWSTKSMHAWLCEGNRETLCECNLSYHLVSTSSYIHLDKHYENGLFYTRSISG
jgi:hypothetical protein